MAVIRRNTISNDIEKKVIIGLIMDDVFCGQVIKMARKNYFKIDYSRTIFKWISDYYKLYKRAPKKEISNIFLVEQDSLKESEAELVKTFLSRLSDNYAEDKITNYEYLKDQTREYFRSRSLDILAEKIQGELAKGRIDHAENEVRNFLKVTKETSNWFNPFDVSNVNQVFDEDDNDKLFKFPGALGDICGYFERDWLVAFMAPMKRGKSWWLQELVIHALHNGLKVVYFSFEMNKRAVSKRIYKRLTALATTTGGHKIPVFDCERNQDGSCKKEKRVCDIAIKPPGGKTPEFKHIKGYMPCTACRKLGVETEYEVATWWGNVEQKKEFNSIEVAKKVKSFKTMYGDNLRVMAYPAFSASFDDAENDLEELEAQENFVPDLIAYDYFDISNPGAGASGFSERGVADYVWKRGKGQASKRHCMVATVLQSNRKSINKKSLEQEDTSEDIRKLAHVDLLAGINQTSDEKEMGVSRVSIIGHRHEEFSFNGEAMVLQSFALGQPFLDDEKIDRRDI